MFEEVFRSEPNFNSIRFWTEPCQCNNFRQHISKTTICRLNTRHQDRQTDVQTNSKSFSDSNGIINDMKWSLSSASECCVHPHKLNVPLHHNWCRVQRYVLGSRRIKVQDSPSSRISTSASFTSIPYKKVSLLDFCGVLANICVKPYIKNFSFIFIVRATIDES